MYIFYICLGHLLDKFFHISAGCDLCRCHAKMSDNVPVLQCSKLIAVSLDRISPHFTPAEGDSGDERYTKINPVVQTFLLKATPDLQAHTRSSLKNRIE